MGRRQQGRRAKIRSGVVNPSIAYRFLRNLWTKIHSQLRDRRMSGRVRSHIHLNLGG